MSPLMAEPVLAAGPAPEVEPEPEAPFVRALLDQLRAQDTYGGLDTRSWRTLLADFLLRLPPGWERARPPAGLMPMVPQSNAGQHRAECFFSAVAREVRRRTGRDASSVVVLGREGMGRALVLVGRLVAAHAYLRDIDRFGFAGMEKLEAEGERYIAEAAESAARWPEPAARRC